MEKRYICLKYQNNVSKELKRQNAIYFKFMTVIFVKVKWQKAIYF